jgi:hypothetical protein
MICTQDDDVRVRTRQHETSEHPRIKRVREAPDGLNERAMDGPVRLVPAAAAVRKGALACLPALRFRQSWVEQTQCG